jgi:predicted DsbA family dithiol-disulfide isomerase
MTIEIWSDIVCPWCYIGKRRFEAALAGFEHRGTVQVVWRSFELDPDRPRGPGLPLPEMLAKKYGMSIAKARSANEQITAIAAGEGLSYHLDTARTANSFAAHRLVHLARTRGIAEAMQERLMKAYFSDGLAIGDPEVLTRLAAEAGLDVAEARATLEGDAFADDVRRDEEKAAQLGINGVPFFVIEERWGVSGAQPLETFKNALNESWKKLEESSGPISPRR